MKFLFPLVVIFLILAGCVAPKYVPTDLEQLQTAEALGQASERAYRQAKSAPTKEEKLKFSYAGISYSEKCLEKTPENPQCLYYNVLNRGSYIQNHIPDYQKSLRKMVEYCERLVKIQPAFEQGGCYRVLGNIYAQAPSFSLNPKNITRDLDQSVAYLQEARRVAPDNALNRLFLARSLEAVGNKVDAKQELAEFDRLKTTALDQEYPKWKKEREELAHKLQKI